MRGTFKASFTKTRTLREGGREEGRKGRAHVIESNTKHQAWATAEQGENAGWEQAGWLLSTRERVGVEGGFGVQTSKERRLLRPNEVSSHNKDLKRHSGTRKTPAWREGHGQKLGAMRVGKVMELEGRVPFRLRLRVKEAT